MRAGVLAVLVSILALTYSQAVFPNYAWTSGTYGGVEGSIASRVNAQGETIVFWSGFDDSLTAAKAKDGSVIWKTLAVGEMIRATPAIYDFNATHAGVLVIGGDAQLWCFDADTGAKIWAVPTGGKKQEFQASSPAVFGSTILFGSLDRNIKAVNAIDGSPVWQLPTGATIYSSVRLGLESARPGAATLGCIGSDDGALYVFEAATGKLRWTKGTGDFIRGSCVFYTDPNFNNGNSVVYFGSNSRSLFAVDAVTGKQIWVHGTPGGEDYATPIVHRFDNGTVVVFAGSYDYNVYALDGATGTTLWNYKTAGYVVPTPLLYNGKIYVGCDLTFTQAFVYQLDASTGALLSEASGAGQAVWSAARAISVAGTNQTFIMLGDQGGNVWAYYP